MRDVIYLVMPSLSTQIDRNSGEVIKTHPRVLPKNTSGKVVLSITSGNRVPLDLYSNSKTLGRFMLRQNGVTVAAGIVVKHLETK